MATQGCSNYKLNVHIARKGTTYINSKGEAVPSRQGHMYYTITDSRGIVVGSYGYAPVSDKHDIGSTMGKVYNDDFYRYDAATTVTVSFDITDGQVDKLKDFGEHWKDYGFSDRYWAPQNSCVDFVWKALEVAGINKTGDKGAFFPDANIVRVKELINEHLIMCEKPDWVGDDWKDWFGLNRSGLFHIYDPLVLDLDGDGVELVNADGWNGVQFDFNGNGIKTATQWVKSDDGLLVWDRNNNGAIDDGSELFGQDTPTKYGDPVTDGFSALKTVESMEYKNSIIGAANDTIFAFQAA